MADRKTVTRQTFIGEKGIALIERRCLEMGHLFHPRRVDHGIDGHIDLVDPDSQAVLNLTLLVQSKAQDRRFSGETDDGFHYLCDQRDLDHWLSGNSPVILVFSHPESDEAWWVEIKAAFPDAVSRASRRVDIDKHAQPFDRDAAQALLRLAMPRTTGLHLRPAPITEVLTTNLLPVIEMPPTVHLAPTAFTDYRAAGGALEAHGRRESGWILRDNLVLSFHDLRDSPLRVLCDGDPERHETREWADSGDLDTQHRFADLLSRTVQDSYPELRWHKDRKHMHFRATSHLGPRKAGKGPGSRGRTVFGPHTSKSDPQRVGYYHHAALRTRFRRLDGIWYCQLEPDYCFTTDGYSEYPFADRLLAGIKRLDRHPAVRGWTRMWANYLRQDADLFTEARPVQFGELATMTVDRGIDDRWWGPAPSGAAPEDDQDASSGGQESLDTVLAGADTETEDLLSLLQDSESDTGASRRRNPRSKSRSAGLRKPRQGRAGSARPLMDSVTLDEPELEFGGAARHVDPRFGITNYGPADLGAADAPRAIRVGLVGPADQLDGLRRWLERCREPIAAKDEKYPHLFPEFPGCDTDRGLHTTLVFSDRNTRAISSRDLRAIETASQPAALTKAVSIYAEEIKTLADENRVDVLLVARPEQLIDTVGRSARSLKAADDLPAADRLDEPAPAQFANFHDLLKARLLHLRQPIQIIRRSTWDEATRPPEGHSRQDEASRAWNLHVALYYKAGGVPWRLLRNPADLTTCYVGVAFYRSDDGSSLSTSVAQVFNERGDGVIVRGGPARISRTDRQPHLARTDAHALLVHALDAYRREHHTAPARIVLHKTSTFTDDEAGGFQDAADERFIDTLEMSWITSSEGAAAFRPGDAPPLRGTLVTLGARELALYATGSIEFYRTYPGMHVPRPIGIRPVTSVRDPRQLAAEVLALTKMNWNQTRLDGRLPVTLRTANQVKSVLRFCPPDQAVATRYAHYM